MKKLFLILLIAASVFLSPNAAIAASSYVWGPSPSQPWGIGKISCERVQLRLKDGNYRIVSAGTVNRNSVGSFGSTEDGRRVRQGFYTMQIFDGGRFQERKSQEAAFIPFSEFLDPNAFSYNHNLAINGPGRATNQAKKRVRALISFTTKNEGYVHAYQDGKPIIVEECKDNVAQGIRG